jgi:hypothetical protein
MSFVEKVEPQATEGEWRMTRLPNFTAESAIGKSHNHYRSRYLQRGGPTGVTPAACHECGSTTEGGTMMCCDPIDIICRACGNRTDGGVIYCCGPDDIQYPV